MLIGSMLGDGSLSKLENQEKSMSHFEEIHSKHTSGDVIHVNKHSFFDSIDLIKQELPNLPEASRKPLHRRGRQVKRVSNSERACQPFRVVG